MDNIIFVGEKNFPTYERVILSKLSQNKEVILKTRGKFIYNAVRIVSILQKEKKVVIKKIEISNSSFEKEGKTYSIPNIEITLIRK